MLRGIFLLLYLVTNRDAMIDLVRLDWNFAVFNAGFLFLLGSGRLIGQLIDLQRRRLQCERLSRSEGVASNRQ